jgi:hypothetical protein
VRVNSLGAKLRSSDLALAQITSKWRGFMQIMEDFCAEFDDDADYMAEWVMVRLLTVFATKQSLYRSINRVQKADLEAAWEQAKQGAHYAVNFLRHNAEIEQLDQISASILMVPIAVYAVTHNEAISPAEEKKLLKWFYYAHMRGHYGMGSSESILNADLAILFRGGSLDQLLEQLFGHVKKFNLTAEDLAGKNTGSPIFTMLYTVLKHNGAKDWFTGLAISDRSTGASHAIQYHHIFPKSLLQERGIDSRTINEIANLAFIAGKTNRKITNKFPVDYLKTEVLDKTGADQLQLQLIPLDQALWEMNAFPDFLTYRRQAIVETINAFMQRFD